MAACRNYTLLTMTLLFGRPAMALNAHATGRKRSVLTKEKTERF